MSNFDAIPQELRGRDQWLLWDASADTPRRPHWRGDFGISWSDPDDWHSFEEAVSAAQERESWGIGYVMALDNDAHARGLYGCLDLDGCVADPDGRRGPKDWLPSLATFLDGDAYVEYSASGEGIHIPLVGQEAPEWWRDSHFSADEHEGVEYLTNKFVAFTGDQMPESGDAVADTDPAPFLHEAYEVLNDASPVENSSHDYDDSDHDGDLSESEVRDALEHVDSSVPYPQWRDILFAIHDWDATAAGRAVAEDWSMGPGWDDQADELIAKIWDGADQGDGITVGTLIHKASENGWSSSSASLDAAAGATDADARDAAGGTTDGGAIAETDSPTAGPRAFEDRVRDIIVASDNDDIQVKTARHRIALEFLQEFDFVYPEDEVRGWRSVLYVFDDSEGIYEPRGETVVKQRLERAAGDFVTNQAAREIVGKIERMAGERGDAFETAPNRLVVGNGILDLHTGDLDPYDPSEYHRTKIDIDWSPDAGEPERIDEFLHNIVKPHNVPTLYRLIAHGLYKEYSAEKAAMLIGSGQNGKSVFLDLVEQFLGTTNVTHRALQEFDNNQFAANQLAGKLANVHPDMGDAAVKDMSTFKKLTGRDTMLADVKYEKPVKFENYATLLFAANEMPIFGEDNHAVWRRWLYIDFPYTFDETDPNAKDPTPKRVLMRELTDGAELEALLVRCQREIQAWHQGRQWFADAMRPDEVRDKMKKAAEPVYNFAAACLEPADDDQWLPKDEVRRAYRGYADAEDLPKLNENEFGERLIGLRDYNIESGRPRTDGAQRVYAYKGVRWTERGRQILGLDATDDDQQQEVDDAEQTTYVVLNELEKMVENNDHEPVPREALVWSCTGSGVGKTTADNAVDELLKKGLVVDNGADELLSTR